MNRTTPRRGQPLVALLLILAAWVSGRAALWSATGSHPGLASQIAAIPAAPAGPASVAIAQPAPAATATASAPDGEAPPTLPALAPPTLTFGTAAEPAVELQATSPRIAGGHQMLYLAGLSMLPLPPEAVASGPLPPPMLRAANPVPAVTAPARTSRWSADGWILWRRGGNGFAAAWPGGAYGASQLGAVVRYRLAPSSAARPTAYLRATSAINAPRGEELAAGLAIRPLRGVAVAAMAELRATRLASGAAILRPAVALVSEFPPLDLPLRLRGEAYVQAGWVGGHDPTPFIDGQARLERPLARVGGMELRAGAGAWGGAQRGASRLDVGPSATLALPLGAGGGRLSADWRFRLAGDAAPGSGPALTLSAGF